MMTKYEIAKAINAIIQNLEFGDFEENFVDDCVAAMMGADPFTEKQLEALLQEAPQ